MDRAGLLTELYRAAKRESLSAIRIQELEFEFESALHLAGRFDFENASSVLLDILTALQLFPRNELSLRLQARCLTELGNIRRDQGYVFGPSGAFSLYTRARTIWRQLDELDKIALTTWYLGACNEMTQNHGTAMLYYKEALDIIDAIGDLETLRARVLMRMGTVLTKAGALDEASASLSESLTLLENRALAGSVGFALQKLAIVDLQRGHKEKAQRMVFDTLGIIPQSDKFRLTQTKILLADLLLSTGDDDAALEVASEAEILAQQHGFKHQLSALYRVLEKHTSQATQPESIEPRVASNELGSDICEVLTRSFSEEEIRELSADLGVRYEDLTGENKAAKVHSLVIRLDLLGRLNQLAYYIPKTSIPSAKGMRLAEHPSIVRSQQTIVIEHMPQESYSIAGVRALIRAAFTDKELRRFCQDRPTFRPVLSRFGPKFSFDDMIDALIDYAETRLLFPDLLSEIRAFNPNQFRRYASKL